MKTVTIGKSKTRHLVVGKKDATPLCRAVEPEGGMQGDRTRTTGDVTCKNCKRVLATAVESMLA